MVQQQDLLQRWVLRLMVPIFLLAGSFAQAQGEDLSELSLEDLLNIETTVASGSKDKALTSREAPAIISVITGEEIRKKGYRDLVDILKTVPGFGVETGQDNAGTVVPTLRGFRAGEGKMLLQFNGFNYTEPSYVNVEVYNRFPVDAIKRIEIIRGPGSAIYGGWAELTVVNVIMKEGADFNGFNANVFASQMEKAPGRRNLNLSFGKREGEVNVAGTAFFGNAELGDREFTDEKGDTYRFDEQTGFDSTQVHLMTQLRDFTTRFSFTEYASQSTDNFFDNPPTFRLTDAYEVNYNMMGFQASYDARLLSDKLIITPLFEFTRWKAWMTTDGWSRTNLYYNNDSFDRTRGQLSALYKAADWFDFLAGVETNHYDVVFDNNGWGLNDVPMYYSTLGLFAQGTAKLNNFNLTVGARRETTTINDESAMVPRIGLTSILGDMHFKLLYSQAFRTPSSTQFVVRGTPNISPETGTVTEAEFGIKLTPDQFLTFNLYSITIKDMLRYQGLGYVNTAGEANNRGVEVEYKIVQGWGDAAATASIYEATSRPNVAFQSTEDEKALLGLPRFKYTVQSTINLGSNLFLSPSIVYEKGVYSKVDITDAGSGYVYSEPEKDLGTMVANLYLLYSNPFGWKDLDLGVGVYNLTNAEHYFANSVASGQPPPLPGNSREFGLKLSTRF